VEDDLALGPDAAAWSRGWVTGAADGGYGCASAYLLGLLFSFIVFTLHRVQARAPGPPAAVAALGGDASRAPHPGRRSGARRDGAEHGAGGARRPLRGPSAGLDPLGAVEGAAAAPGAARAARPGDPRAAQAAHRGR